MAQLEEILERLSHLEARLENEKQLMTFEETCRYLRFSKYHLRRLCYRKLIPHYKPTGRTIFFFKQELDKWIRNGSLKKKKSFKHSRNNFRR